MDCPKCVGRLQKITLEINAIAKGKAERSEIELDQCPVCQGVWFDKNELGTYLKQGATAVDSPPIEAKLGKELDEKLGKCPHCAIEMGQAPDPKGRGVRMDVCGRCGGIWLDNTEIDKLEDRKSMFSNERLEILKHKINRFLFG